MRCPKLKEIVRLLVDKRCGRMVWMTRLIAIAQCVLASTGGMVRFLNEWIDRDRLFGTCGCRPSTDDGDEGCGERFHNMLVDNRMWRTGWFLFAYIFL